MKMKTASIGIMIVGGYLIASLFFPMIVQAEPIPISADKAYDMWAEDPSTVAIVDVRTPEEYYWNGTCAQVDEILLEGGLSVHPENGKVTLHWGGRFLKYEIEGHPMFLPVRRVEEIETTAIAINIPYETVDCTDPDCTKTTVEEEAFKDDLRTQLEGVETVILMCRSGKRSSACGEWTVDVFGEDNVFEIDHPAKNGRGGFQGTSYANVYNGYRGFPGRATSFQDYTSVSWSDAGLPIHIGECPTAGPWYELQ